MVELYWEHAPRTCRNFADLCRRGYYNDTKFHRVVPDFMIQGRVGPRLDLQLLDVSLHELLLHMDKTFPVLM